MGNLTIRFLMNSKIYDGKWGILDTLCEYLITDGMTLLPLILIYY